MHLSWPVKNWEICLLVIKTRASFVLRAVHLPRSLYQYIWRTACTIAAPFLQLEVSHNYKPSRVKIPVDLRISPRAYASINNRDTEYSAINIFRYHTRHAAGRDCPSRMHSSPIQAVLCSPDYPLFIFKSI